MLWGILVLSSDDRGLIFIRRYNRNCGAKLNVTCNVEKFLIASLYNEIEEEQAKYLFRIN